MSNKPVVFVSCGQYTEVERALGKSVCALIRELRPDVEPYFAQDQSTPEALSSNILKALFGSVGFICVMHRRGEVSTPEGTTITRGSVWVEQEIAITAFLTHALGRSVQTFLYKQAGVGLEGIRSVLLLNPRVEFTEESQVLQHLRAVLPLTQFSPSREYDIIPVLSYRDVVIRGDRHDYTLVADVKNVGHQKVTDFEMRIFFPRAFLNPHVTWGDEDPSRSTTSHICLIAEARTRAPNGLYPGDGMRNPLTMEYFMNGQLFHDPQAMESAIRVELFSESMESKKQDFPIKNFQKF